MMERMFHEDPIDGWNLKGGPGESRRVTNSHFARMSAESSSFEKSLIKLKSAAQTE